MTWKVTIATAIKHSRNIRQSDESSERKYYITAGYKQNEGRVQNGMGDCNKKLFLFITTNLLKTSNYVKQNTVNNLKEV